MIERKRIIICTTEGFYNRIIERMIPLHLPI